VDYPLVLGLLSLMGYRYVARALTELLLETVWLAVELVFIAGLAKRWLLVTRRRLAYEAAVERRQSLAREQRAKSGSRSGDGAASFEPEEPEVDVLDLSDRSRRLVNTAILLYLQDHSLGTGVREGRQVLGALAFTELPERIGVHRTSTRSADTPMTGVRVLSRGQKLCRAEILSHRPD
jgi:hypothetical protein